MQATSLAEKYFTARYSFFKWRYSLSLVNKVVMASAMACVTGLLALVRVPLPFTPVPITGQVLGVLLSGVVCGGLFGSVSQLIYVGLGITAGIPWFAGGASYSIDSFIYLPTCGYLVGFVIAPLIIGKYTDRYISARGFLSQMRVMMIGVGIIYIFGAVGLSLVIGSGFRETMMKGVVPFILGGFIKAAIASGISFSILPKTSYNGEIDKSKYEI